MVLNQGGKTMTTQNEKKYIEKLKQSYSQKTPTKTQIDELKELDNKVKIPARAFAYTYGSVGSLVLGTGMCLAMKIIGNIMPLGIAIGIIGIAMVSSTYSIYSKILSNRKAKYSDKIIAKSNELLNQKEGK